MNLPKLSEANIRGKKVLLRLDLDVSEDISRVKAAEETLKFLIENLAKTIIFGHKGRPGGVKDEKLSLEKMTEPLSQISGRGVDFSPDIIGISAEKKISELKEGALVLLENLRFDPGEEKNDQVFSEKLAFMAEYYVNEAFAVSHREHASIVGVPRHLPHAAGIRFVKEIEKLDKVLADSRFPRIVIISGVKEDKVAMAKSLTDKFDKVLVAGRLPEYMGDNTVSIRSLEASAQLIVANLIMDKEDITIHSIERFKTEIDKAKTIVLAGVPGKYEDEGHRQGTKEIFEAVAASGAYKVAGGGDTHVAINMFGLKDKFDWISVGGGAMLEYFSKGTLPGIEALIE
jgi:phosphoglycerate kinase